MMTEAAIKALTYALRRLRERSTLTSDQQSRLFSEIAIKIGKTLHYDVLDNIDDNKGNAAV